MGAGAQPNGKDTGDRNESKGNHSGAKKLSKKNAAQPDEQEPPPVLKAPDFHHEGAWVFDGHQVTGVKGKDGKPWLVESGDLQIELNHQLVWFFGKPQAVRVISKEPKQTEEFIKIRRSVGVSKNTLPFLSGTGCFTFPIKPGLRYRLVENDDPRYHNYTKRFYGLICPWFYKGPEATEYMFRKAGPIYRKHFKFQEKDIRPNAQKPEKKVQTKKAFKIVWDEESFMMHHAPAFRMKKDEGKKKKPKPKEGEQGPGEKPGEQPPHEKPGESKQEYHHLWCFKWKKRKPEGPAKSDELEILADNVTCREWKIMLNKQEIGHVKTSHREGEHGPRVREYIITVKPGNNVLLVLTAALVIMKFKPALYKLLIRRIIKRMIKIYCPGTGLGNACSAIPCCLPP